MSSSDGVTRATHRCFFCSAPSVHTAFNTMVSDDIPFESIPLSTVICGFAPPGTTVHSQDASRSGRVVTSRLERWSFMSASGCSAAKVPLRKLVRPTRSVTQITVRSVA